MYFTELGDIPRSLCDRHERESPMPRPWKTCLEGAEMGKANQCEASCGQSAHNNDLCQSFKAERHGKVLWKACTTGMNGAKKWAKRQMVTAMEEYVKLKSGLRRRLGHKKKRKLRKKKKNLRPQAANTEGEDEEEEGLEV